MLTQLISDLGAAPPPSLQAGENAQPGGGNAVITGDDTADDI